MIGHQHAESSLFPSSVTHILPQLEDRKEELSDHGAVTKIRRALEKIKMVCTSETCAYNASDSFRLQKQPLQGCTSWLHTRHGNQCIALWLVQETKQMNIRIGMVQAQLDKADGCVHALCVCKHGRCVFQNLLL